MHEDMEGSAVALGTLLALTELKVDFPVDCWLALAQNHIGPKAYKQNDIVKAANGKTIEVVHTDAEGRMVLADTLYFASQAKTETAHRLRHAHRRLHRRAFHAHERRVHQPRGADSDAHQGR